MMKPACWRHRLFVKDEEIMTTRRIALLMMWSAIVMPAQAMANCTSERMDIPRSFGVDLSKGIIREAFIGGGLAALAVSTFPAVVGTVGAIAIFTGVVALRALLPSMRRAADDTFSALDNAFMLE
jgi:hypothetical protein